MKTPENEETLISLDQLKTDPSAQDVVRRMDITRGRNTVPRNHTSDNGGPAQEPQRD
jgi:hypothetical protein